MEIPKALLDRLQKNEEIARKFHEIEVSILSILDFHNFFDRLLTEISDKFCIPHIWVAMISEGRLARQLAARQMSCRLASSMVNVSGQIFSSIVTTPKPLLANTGLTAYEKIIPQTLDRDIGSIAVARSPWTVKLWAVSIRQIRIPSVLNRVSTPPSWNSWPSRSPYACPT